MKRIFCLLLTLCLCLGLFAGCLQGSDEVPEPSPSSAPIEPQTPATPEESELEPLYTRLRPERIEALEPGEDYGVLHPFAGELSYSENGAATYTYGLFDSNGRIVCDPVYHNIDRLSPQLNLSDVDSIPMLGLWRRASGNSRCAVASLDGRFVSPEYSYVIPFSYGVLCADNNQSEEFTVYGFDGTELFTEESRFEGGLRIARANCFGPSAGSCLIAWLMDDESGLERAYLLTNVGEILAGGWAEAEFVGSDAVKFRHAGDGLWGLAAVILDATQEPGSFDVVNISRRCETVLEPLYSDIRLCGSGWYAENEEGAYIFDFFGEPLMEVPEGAEYARWGYVHEGVYYLTNGSVIELGAGWYTPIDAAGDCELIVLVEEEGVRIKNLFTGAERFVEGLGYGGVFGLNPRYFAAESGLRCIWYHDGETPVLTDWRLEREFEFPILSPEAGFYSIIDGLNNDELICATNIGGGEDLYRFDGSLFAVGGTWDSIWNGLRVTVDENYCIYGKPMGEAIFIYPIEVTEDLRGAWTEPASDTDLG